MKALCVHIFLCYIHYFEKLDVYEKEYASLIDKDKTMYFEGTILYSMFEEHFTLNDYLISHFHLFIFNKLLKLK